MRTLPAILVTGCLGAGKTTFLNHLLSLPEISEKHLTLIINEFGPAGVDATLVREGEYPKYEINKGSLFCICTRVDFINVLKEISTLEETGLIIIEATGIAETSDIESFLEEPVLHEKFAVSANICIVDALNFTKVAPFMKAARRQVEWADGIIINKADLVPKGDVEKLSSLLQDINPQAKLIHAVNAEAPYSFITSIKHHHRTGTLAKGPPPDIIAVSIKTQATVNKGKFTRTIASLGDSLLRLKGYIDFGNGPHYCEVVYDRIIEKPELPGPSNATEFTAIAYKITKEELTALLTKTFLDNGPGN